MKDDVKTKAIKSLYKVQLREACFYFTLISIYLFGRKKIEKQYFALFLMARYQSIDIAFLTPQNGRAKSQKSLK